MSEQTTLATQGKTQVQKQPKSWQEALSIRIGSIEDALPKDFNRARFVQNALAVVSENKDIQKYGQDQIFAGLVKGAILGVDFSNKECYLVPYGNQLQFQLDYKGCEKIAKKYSIRPIKEIVANVVRKGDEFSSEIVDSTPVVNFKPMPFNDGEIVGAFAYVIFQDGGILVDTMSLKELENTRSKSKMGKSGAWRDFTSEMYKKTVIRRLMKQIEVDMENPTQKELYFDDEAVIKEPEEIIEVTQAEIEENQNSIPFSIDE